MESVTTASQVRNKLSREFVGRRVTLRRDCRIGALELAAGTNGVATGVTVKPGAQGGGAGPELVRTVRVRLCPGTFVDLDPLNLQLPPD